MVGNRLAVVAGPRLGLAAGLSADPLVPPSTGGAIPGVTRDATDGRYYPANATEWTALLVAAADAAGNPSSTWNCQEPSGSLADAIGTVALAQLGAGHLYQQTVAGSARKAVMTVDGTANQRWGNGVQAPNPSTTSTLAYAVINLPGVAPAAARDVLTMATNVDLRLNTTGKLRVVFGAQADLANSNLGTTIYVWMQADITASADILFTPLEKLVGTFATPTNANLFANGGQTATAAAIAYLYLAQFTGAAAQRTSAQLKTITTTLGWPTPPWS